VPPAYFVAKHVILFHGHATPRHTVRAVLLRTAQSGVRVGQPFWGCSPFPECRAVEPLHWFNQVRIAADHNRALEAMLIRVVQEVRGEVDVGTLLFSLEDLDEWILSGTRMDERQANRVGQEVSVVDLEIRSRPQGAEIRLLARGLVGVTGTRQALCREVLDASALVAWEHDLQELGKVESLVGGATARAKVEVEGVNVEEGKHNALPKMQGPSLSERPCALSPKLPGMVMVSL
jgi:hypothetical protein